MNRRVKFKLAPFVVLLAVLLCIYFVIPICTVDRFRDKFTITGVEILPQEQVPTTMDHNVPVKLSQPPAPQQQGSIMEHKIPNRTLAGTATTTGKERQWSTKDR